MFQINIILATILLLFNITIQYADGTEIPTNFKILENLKSAKSLTRYGITWTFSEPVEYGQFANGDYWVLDKGTGISICQITPLSTETAGRIMNGSMLNPTTSSNGYDSSVAHIAYDPSLNVGRPHGETLSTTNPLIIKGEASLVSTRTNETPGSRPQLIDSSVLTVLTKVPPSGSFRPPYAGQNKSLNWNVENIQWQLLPRLPKSMLTSIPDLKNLETKIERVWLDHGGGVWTGRELHPSNNMPDYGRDMANITGDISLALLLDFDRTELSPLLIKFLQLGIDWYGITNNTPDIFHKSSQGALWMGGGGQGHGRKWPMLFTGLMFNDSAIMSYGNASNFPIFQEEQQYFYVSQLDVDQARYSTDGRPRDPYTPEMIGTPEWGEKHMQDRSRDGSNWDAYYREIVSKSIAGHALAAILMNSKDIWNWNSFFEYQDRWAEHQKSINQNIAFSSFVNEMWTTFRNYSPK